jgi:hypothetical protein
MNDEPQIIISGEDLKGLHNQNLRQSRMRIKEGKAYRDISTVVVIPTRGKISDRVVEAWWNLMMPMNQHTVRMFIRRMEVGEAYNAAVETILEHPILKNFRYMLTLEEDNIPPPDGLIRLYESVDDFSVIAGLYWTKGEGGQPMIYGDPKTILAFQPQPPLPGRVQECNGVGMGFTLFDLKIFRDERIPKPWFKTVQSWSQTEGAAQGTQDLYFMQNARRAGYRIASDNRVRVGHYDDQNDIVW